LFEASLQYLFVAFFFQIGITYRLRETRQKQRGFDLSNPKSFARDQIPDFARVVGDLRFRIFSQLN
ncbi:hypothetical protein CEN50_09640, partial [Fischerella thermalis CCMEE 5268]